MPRMLTLNDEEAELVLGSCITDWEVTDGDDDPDIVARNKVALGLVAKIDAARLPTKALAAGEVDRLAAIAKAAEADVVAIQEIEDALAEGQHNCTGSASSMPDAEGSLWLVPLRKVRDVMQRAKIPPIAE